MFGAKSQTGSMKAELLFSCLRTRTPLSRISTVTLLRFGPTMLQKGLVAETPSVLPTLLWNTGVRVI